MRLIFALLVSLFLCGMGLTASGQDIASRSSDSLHAPAFTQWSEARQLSVIRRAGTVDTARLEALARPGQPALRRAMAYRCLGQLYLNSHQWNLAVQRLLTGYQLLEARRDSNRLAPYAQFIGWAYCLSNSPREGLRYAQLALSLTTPRTSLYEVARIYNVIGMAHGYFHDRPNQIAGFRQAALISIRLNDMHAASTYYYNLLEPYVMLNRLVEARRVLDSAYLLRPDSLPRLDYYLLAGEADLLAHEKRYAESIRVAERIVTHCRSFKDYNLLGGVLRSLAPVYAIVGRPQDAYVAQLRLTGINDTLFEQTALTNTQQLAALYDTQKRTAQLTAQRRRIGALAADARLREVDLRRRTTLLYAVLAVVGLLVALAVAVQNRSRLRQRANALLNAQKLELTIAATKLETLNRTKDRLFAIVAHDLRNPLSALTGIQALIQRYVRRGEPERLVELGDHLQQTAQTLYGVLDNVLGWAVSQSGELEARPEAVSVAALVREAADIGRLQATASDIAFTVEVGPDPDLVTDRQMLRTILRNVLGNALKFTPAEGHVTFTAEAETAPGRTGVIFRITDSGPGFSAAAAAAWEAAAPGPRTSDASGRSGVGLGLVVCRAFATQLGGALTWRNRPEGGAEVQLWLPLVG